MDQYYKRQVKGPPFKGNEEMQYEGVRLITFKDWPNWGSVWPTVLAKAGFYYTGTVDQVACFSCSGRLKTWEAGDSPKTEHRRFFPQCRFVTGRDTRNVPFGDTTESLPVPSGGQRNQTHNTHASYAGASFTGNNRPSSSVTLGKGLCGSPREQPHTASADDTQHCTLLPLSGLLLQYVVDNPTPRSELGIDTRRQTHHHPNYAIEANRQSSFRQWPQNSTLSSGALASAGFFYTGQGDSVRCFSCGGELCNWEMSDEAWREHARWFPSCHYVTTVKGEAFIRRTQAQYSGQTSTARRVNHAAETGSGPAIAVETTTGAPAVAALPVSVTPRLVVTPGSRLVPSTASLPPSRANREVQDQQVLHNALNAFYPRDSLDPQQLLQRHWPITQPHADSPTRLDEVFAVVSAGDGILFTNNTDGTLMRCDVCRRGEAYASFLPCHHRCCRICAQEHHERSVCPGCLAIIGMTLRRAS